MSIARVTPNNKIIEIRAMEYADIPLHKRYLWRQVIDAPPIINVSTQTLVDNGWLFSNSTHIERNYAVIPKTVEQVSSYQLKMALNKSNHYETAANLISASANNEMKIAWDDAQIFFRDDAFILELQTDLTLSTEEMDTIFLNAYKELRR